MAMAMTKVWPCLAAALAVLVCAADAQTSEGPIGVVDDPCLPKIEIPKSIIDEAVARLKPGFDGQLPPVPAADRQIYKERLAARARRDWAGLCQYREADLALAVRPASERRVVFLGDSITQNWIQSDPDLFTHGVVNRGVGTQTTQQILLRFQSDVVALHPDVVQIQGGVNDLAGNTGPTTMEAIENNFIAMVSLARANHIRVLLASMFPADHLSWSPTIRPVGQIQALNAWLRAYAAREGLTYVDYYNLLAAPGGAMKPELTVDGVHPNAKGYALIRPLVDQTLAHALAK
jgi:lysophospholipase L1-like esterase